jgi:hypothetical protein
MNLFDQLVLLATGLVAIYAIWMLMGRQKDEATKHFANIYFMISFAVLLVSGLMLIALGWEILGLLGHGSGTSRFVAVVATLIPFSLATGLVSRFYPEHEKMYLSAMILGVVLIAVSRFTDMGTFAKIIYPIFHSIAGLTIFVIPIMEFKKGTMSKCFLWVTLGGTLIGLGGIALAFLTAGKQLLFFSPEFVLMILAPLLFLTAFSYMWGLKKGDK